MPSFRLLESGSKRLLEDGTSRRLLDGLPTAFWNLLDAAPGWGVSESNLRAAIAIAGFNNIRANSGRSTGQRYLEFKQNAGNGWIGLATADLPLTDYFGSAYSAGWYQPDGAGYIFANGNWADLTGYSGPNGNWLAMAVDLDAGYFWIRQPAGWVGDPVAATGGFSIANIAGRRIFPGLGSLGEQDVTVNLGETAFNYTPPAGYSAWDTPESYKLYRGANWTGRYKGGLTDAQIYKGAGLLR